MSLWTKAHSWQAKLIRWREDGRLVERAGRTDADKKKKKIQGGCLSSVVWLRVCWLD